MEIICYVHGLVQKNISVSIVLEQLTVTVAQLKPECIIPICVYFELSIVQLKIYCKNLISVTFVLIDSIITSQECTDLVLGLLLYYVYKHRGIWLIMVFWLLTLRY